MTPEQITAIIHKVLEENGYALNVAIVDPRNGLDLTRAVAELDNYRKRTSTELARARKEERARAAAQWLPVIDNLDLALEHARADPENIVEGVRAVQQQALEILAALGFSRRVASATASELHRIHESHSPTAGDA